MEPTSPRLMSRITSSPALARAGDEPLQRADAAPAMPLEERGLRLDQANRCRLPPRARCQRTGPARRRVAQAPGLQQIGRRVKPEHQRPLSCPDGGEPGGERVGHAAIFACKVSRLATHGPAAVCRGGLYEAEPVAGSAGSITGRRRPRGRAPATASLALVTRQRGGALELRPRLGFRPSLRSKSPRTLGSRW